MTPHANRRSTFRRVTPIINAPAPGQLRITVRGQIYTVHARPIRRSAQEWDFVVGDSGTLHRQAAGNRFASASRGPVRIPPGGCDIYEGEGGLQYVCCKSTDGGHIDCYRITISHGDPWGPPQ